MQVTKKICMVVAEHPFMDARIFQKEAKSLKKQGYDVTMIVPRKNGRLFDIDGTPFNKEFRNKVFTHEGIKIVTYHFEPSRAYLNNVLSDESVWERQGFQNHLTQLAIKENADIYHTHEYMSLFAGIGIKRLMKKQHGKDIKLIYDSHELTPDPLDPRYTPDFREKLKQQLLLMLEEVDYIITVSESIKKWYNTHKPAIPVEVIYNSPPLAKNYKPKQFNSTKLTVGFEGQLDDKDGRKKKIIEITDTCAKQKDFYFKIIGGNRFGKAFAVPKHLQERIIQTGWVKYTHIPIYFADVDMGWIDLENVDQSLNRNYALPNKFFSYLNNGLPIIVNKCDEMRNFIEKHHCGYVIDKTNVTAADYVEAILRLSEDKQKLLRMSKNSRSIMESTYSWEKMEERLSKVYQSLLTN